MIWLYNQSVNHISASVRCGKLSRHLCLSHVSHVIISVQHKGVSLHDKTVTSQRVPWLWMWQPILPIHCLVFYSSAYCPRYQYYYILMISLSHFYDSFSNNLRGNTASVLQFTSLQLLVTECGEWWQNITVANHLQGPKTGLGRGVKYLQDKLSKLLVHTHRHTVGIFLSYLARFVLTLFYTDSTTHQSATITITITMRVAYCSPQTALCINQLPQDNVIAAIHNHHKQLV